MGRLQVIGVMDAMPTSHLKPEGEEVALEKDRLYRTTYMFRCPRPRPLPGPTTPSSRMHGRGAAAAVPRPPTCIRQLDCPTQVSRLLQA